MKATASTAMIIIIDVWLKAIGRGPLAEQR